MTMKLGFTLYNFHSVIDSLEDLDNVLAKLEDMGVDTVQVSGIGFLNNYDVAKLCKKHGMEVCLNHLSFDRIVNDTDAVIEEHKALGCKNVGIGWIEEKYRGEDGVKKLVEELTPAVEKLHAAGMKFAYHNHHFEFMRYPNGKTGYQMLTELDPELISFIFDIHWAQTGGVDPASYIRKLGKRISVCHFKDYRIVKDAEGNFVRDFAEIGTGNLDLDECYRACRDSGIEYIIIEQDSTPLDVFESARISWENLKKIAERN